MDTAPTKMSSRRAVWLAVALAVIVGALVPLSQRRILSLGTDAFEAHHALYGEQVVSQEVALRGDLTGVGAIIVNLHRAAATSPAAVTVAAVDGRVLETAMIPAEAIQDDSFAWVTFNRPQRAPERRALLTFSSPLATKHAALGVRFEAQDSTRLALSLEERVPLWKYAWYEYQTVRGVRLFSWAVLVGLAMWLLIAVPQAAGVSRMSRRWLVGMVLLLMTVGAIGARLAMLRELSGVSGGDPYNYLAITQRIVALTNPLAEDKRLPGYPLLLVPIWLADVDHILFMRLISIASAGGTAVMLALLVRCLSLPWSVQILAPALLLVQKDFLFTSLRPEPYTWYALWLLVALLLFLQQRKAPRLQWLLGIVLGGAAMTRQEGFVLAAVLGVASLLAWKTLWWRGYLRIFVPALVLVLPYFVHTTAAYGNPFFSPYFNSERMEIVNSWNSFRESAGATWGVLGAMWRPRWNAQYRVPVSDPLFLAGLAGTGLWWGLQSKRVARRWWVALMVSVASLAALGSVLFAVRQSPVEFGEMFMRVSAGVLAASVVPFLAATRWPGVLIVAVLASQVLVAVWFQRMPKHFQQDYPLLMLLLAAALAPTRRLMRPVRMAAAVAVLAPFAVVTLMLGTTIREAIDASNWVTAADYVTYQAVLTARKLPGPHGFDFAYQPARLYFGQKAFYYTNEHEKSVPEPLPAWLSQNGIRTLVTTNSTPHSLLPLTGWQETARFRSEGKQEKLMESVVYRVRE